MINSEKASSTFGASFVFMSSAIHDSVATRSAAPAHAAIERRAHVVRGVDRQPLGDERHEGGLERDELLLSAVLQRGCREQQAHALAVIVGVGFVGLRELQDHRADRLDHRLGAGPLVERNLDLVEELADVAKDQVLLGREVPVEGAMRHLGRRADLVDRDLIEASLEEQAHGDALDLCSSALLLSFPQAGRWCHDLHLTAAGENSGICVKCQMCR